MKKLLTFLLLLTAAVAAFGQNKNISVQRINVDSTLIWQGDTIDFNSYIGTNTALEYLQFDTTGAPPAHRQGLIFYDTASKSPTYYNDQGEVANQLGRELWTRCYNSAGVDLPNGSVVYIDTSHNGFPTILPAKADIDTTVCRILGLTTQFIGNGAYGEVCTYGSVRGLNTSRLTMGDGEVYVDPRTAGAFTTTRPVYPDYIVSVGQLIRIDATEGEIFVTRSGSVSDIYNNTFNGITLQSFNFRVTSNGTTVKGYIARSDGSNHLTLNFSTGLYNVDVDPADTIVLTPGTATNPQRNYVYYPESTKALTASTAGWPAGEHIRVATVELLSAVRTQADGALGNQNWNDHLAGNAPDSRGHLTHINDWIRLNPAKYISGAKGSMTIVTAPTPDDVYISTTGGLVSQMHPQTWAATDMATGDDIHVYNDPVTAWKTITNLNTITVDALGATLANKSFSLVLWGIQNQTGEMSHMILNLPIGSYTSGPDAVLDASGYSVYTIPQDFIPKAFLIARFTVTQGAGSNTWTLLATEDLTGRVPNTSAGGGSGGSGATTFLGLTDTPSSYSGQSGKVVRVASGETALEFAAETDPVYSSSVASQISAADTTAYRTAYSWGNHALAGYLTTETDPVFNGSIAVRIDATDTLQWATAYSWGNHASAGYLTVEGDPIFGSSVARGISSVDTANWDKAYNKHLISASFTTGDGTLTLGQSDNGTVTVDLDGRYLVTESDPAFTASPAAGISSGSISDWNTAYGWGNHASAGYLTTETDPVYSSSVASQISAADTTAYRTAYSWGNHASAGYLTTESDPIYSASVASQISAADTTAYRTAYSWGNHASAGYLTAETDPVFLASPAGSITNTNKTNWNTAYSWGDHATLYDPAGTATSTLSGHTSTFNHANYNTAYGWGNHALAGYLTTESDPVFGASAAAGISGTNITNWNTAYGWGNHATLYDPVGTATSVLASHTSTFNHANYNTAYSWGNHALAGYLTAESDPVFGASVAREITAADTVAYRAAYNDRITGGSFVTGTGVLDLNQTDGGKVSISLEGRYLTAESDPVFAASVAAEISAADTTAYRTAYNDKINTAGFSTSTGVLTLTQQDGGTVTADLDGRYLESFSESDPVFAASVAAEISAADTTAYRTAYSWGNHASAGYLTTESDPVFGSSAAYAITSGNIANWSLAYLNMTTSATFNTANGNLGLYQQDGGVVTGNLDGRYSTASFKNIEIAGQTTVAADNLADTLTLVAGTNVTLTTTGDQITISAAGSGSTTFTGLTDTPNSYGGAGGFVTRVNSGATALEFVSAWTALKPAYGYLYADSIVQPYNQNTWTKISGWTDGAYAEVTLNGAGGEITVLQKGTYRIGFNLADKAPAGITHYQIYVNGNPLPQSDIPSTYESRVAHPSISIMVSLDTNDVVTLLMHNDGASNDLNIYGGSLHVERIN